VPLVKRSYPELRLIIHEDLTDDLIEDLRSHRIDTALVALPVTAQDLEIRPLFDEPFFFACPRGHPLARAKTVSDADLCKQRLLLLTDGHCLREQALAVCGQPDAPAEEDADFSATSLETLRQMVAAGMGSTLLPALAVPRPEDRGFAVRPLAAGASRRIGLVWRRAYPKGADLDLLAALMRHGLPSAVHAA
jgi:LysR family hydrogen peroxide-inducible transcriptional activator